MIVSSHLVDADPVAAVVHRYPDRRSLVSLRLGDSGRLEIGMTVPKAREIRDALSAAIDEPD